jgi:uncharacterized protein (DUF302 family)
VITKRSRYSYADTVDHLTKTLRDAGNTVFATIDQAAAAESVELTLRPTTLIIFGNPKGGTPFMVTFPMTALDLPLKLLVWEDNGTVNVTYVPMSEIAARYAVTGMDERVSAMDHALNGLTDGIT